MRPTRLSAAQKAGGAISAIRRLQIARVGPRGNAYASRVQSYCLEKPRRTAGLQATAVREPVHSGMLLAMATPQDLWERVGTQGKARQLRRSRRRGEIVHGRRDNRRMNSAKGAGRVRLCSGFYCLDGVTNPPDCRARKFSRLHPTLAWHSMSTEKPHIAGIRAQSSGASLQNPSGDCK